MNEVVNKSTKDELNIRKEILNKHLAEFNRLKQAGNWSAAWQQLLVTLNYANDTLKYSANLLGDISNKMPQLSPEQQSKIEKLTNRCKNISPRLQEKIKSAGLPTEKSKSKKMIIIPKKQNVH